MVVMGGFFFFNLRASHAVTLICFSIFFNKKKDVSTVSIFFNEG